MSTLGVLLLAACGGSGVERQPQAVAAAHPSAEPSAGSALDASALPATRAVRDGAFSTSPVCDDCHANEADSAAMRDEVDRPIAPRDLWRASLMAGAVRDPFFRAVVSAEMAAAPAHAEAIESKCLSCHGPMASRQGQVDGVEPTLDMVYEDGDRAQLLLDGVSCTLCHQITSDGLGTEDSYTGRYELNTVRDTYGPHESPRVRPMRIRTGYTPRRAGHATESALCGSCHTLITEALDASGDPTGLEFTEQTAYLEWRNSIFNDELASPSEAAASCQDCHVPTVSEDGIPIRTAIASVRGQTGRGRSYRWRRGRGDGGMNLPERSPFGRHLFLGGNTAVLRMLLANRDELNPDASSAALQTAIQATRQILQNDTARLTVAGSTRVDDALHVSLRVENLTGHKLPTGIPSRRMWLRVRLLDDDGTTVFESGAYDTSGRILGSDGNPLASETLSGPTEIHRGTITAADQVQIYEGLMADSDGLATFRLLRAATHLKDNRLLPLGWSADHEEAEHTEPHGEAAEDADFTAGQDVVTYEIDAPASAGPYQLEASLLYQAIGQRFAAELLPYETPEVEDFAQYYTSAVRAPEELCALTVALP